MVRKKSRNNSVHCVTRHPPPRIYQHGRDILFNVRFQAERTALRCRARQFLVPQMVLIALVTFGLLGDAFMLYALIHWVRDGGNHRNE